MRFTRAFESWLDEPVLRVGKVRWSRSELARDLGVVSVRAAQNATRVLNELRVSTPEGILEYSADDYFDVDGIGERTIAVLAAIIYRYVGEKAMVGWLTSEDENE